MKYAWVAGTLAVITAACGERLAREPMALAPDAVRLRILDTDWAPVTTAQLTLLVVTGAHGVYATTVPTRPERHTVLPADFRGDFATVAPLPAGRWALLVDDGQHAPTTSMPFELPHDAGLEITVRMARGVSIEGMLRGDRDRAIAGAHVEVTAPVNRGMTTFCVSSGQFPEPARIGRSTTTREDGSFRLNGIAAGDYGFVVRHPEFAAVHGTLRLSAAERRVLEPLALLRGTEVSGIVTIAGRGTTAAKVTLHGSITPGAARGDGLELSPWRHFAAISQPDGSYHFTERIPTGSWWIQACQQTQTEPFGALRQWQATRHEFALSPSTARWTRSFEL